MVVGLGIDVIQNERIRDSVTKFGTRFINRIYTEIETGYCNKCADPGIHFAARFAAKEAAFKAFARALESAITRDPRVQGVPSTKGVL